MSEETHASVILTDATFESEVTGFDGVVLVDFWAAWCGPCQMMAPRIEAIAQKYAGNAKVKVGKLNVDEQEQTGMALRIMSLPTFKVFVKGQVVDEVIGATSQQNLEAVIEKYLPKA